MLFFTSCLMYIGGKRVSFPQHLVQLYDYVRRTEMLARACTSPGEPFIRRYFMHHDIACDINAIARYTLIFAVSDLPGVRKEIKA